MSAGTVLDVRLQPKHARQCDVMTTVLMMCAVVKVISVKTLEV